MPTRRRPSAQNQGLVGKGMKKEKEQEQEQEKEQERRDTRAKRRHRCHRATALRRPKAETTRKMLS